MWPQDWQIGPNPTILFTNGLTMHEKKKSESVVAQSCPTLCDPIDYI